MEKELTVKITKNDRFLVIARNEEGEADVYSYQYAYDVTDFLKDYFGLVKDS